MTNSLDQQTDSAKTDTSDSHVAEKPSLGLNKLPNNAVVCLMAPTASGKTSLAYELYDTGRFEIVSIDSALIYRDMNIGTAKPTEEELRRYPHHMVNIIDPTETYSVASFVADVEALIEQIHARGKIPLLVGGTMMYYMAMFTGLSPVPETNTETRLEVERWREEAGIEALYDYLKQVDPEIAQRLNATDTQRITRAIEVYKDTGKPLSQWQKLPKQAIADNPNQVWLGLAVMPDRAWLHERIALRLQLMWNEGFVDEVLSLLNRYSLSADMSSMRCVGYRQVLDYLAEVEHPIMQKVLNTEEGAGQHQAEQNKDSEPLCSSEVACQDMQNKALYATRQLAKRQYTWLRNLVNTHSLESQLNDLNQSKPLSAPENSPDYNNESSNSIIGEKVSKVVIPFSSIQEAKAFLSDKL